MPNQYHISNETERFLSKIDKTNVCWIWKAGCFSDGYGQFWTKRGNLRAHRYSWILHHGDIPNDLHVLHKCDNPLCVNPDHLFLGTEKDNAIDRDMKGRHAVSRGYVQSDETKTQRSKTLKITHCKSMLGKQHSQETKLKMSESSKKRNKDAKGRFI